MSMSGVYIVAVEIPMERGGKMDKKTQIMTVVVSCRRSRNRNLALYRNDCIVFVKHPPIVAGEGPLW